MIALRLWAVCLFLILPHTQVSAADDPIEQERKLYDVEIIIFKNLNVPKSHEFNLPTPSATRRPETIDLWDPASVEKAAAAGFTPLPSDELRLQDSVSSIVRSSRYSLLIHTGWRQPGLEENETIPVWIKGGQVFDKRYSSIDQVIQLPEPTAGENDGEKNETRQQRFALYELEGQITITLSRYLHTHAELVLRKPAQPGNLLVTNEQPGNLEGNDERTEDLMLQGQLLLNYALNEQRRMRSRKLHYLDHPEFGMLVMITPYEPTPTGDTAPDDGQSPVPASDASGQG